MAQREAGTVASLDTEGSADSKKPRTLLRLRAKRIRYGKPSLYQTRIVMLESRISRLKEELGETLPQKIETRALVPVTVALVPVKLEPENPKPGRTIWVLRTGALSAGMTIASLLLVYSLIFLETFLSVGSTTSYFPWAWRAYYTTFNSVQTMYFVGFGISVVSLTFIGVGLFLTIQKLRKLSQVK